ncbi:MAG: ATPase family associated with various cellular [Verrucomicrobiota bacterium]|jgi:hypothetical protein
MNQYPFVTFLNLEPDAHEIFAYQCGEFASYVLLQLDSLDLDEVLRAAHTQYRLRVHALEILAYRCSESAIKDRLEVARAEELVLDVCEAVRLMFGTDREAISTAYEALDALNLGGLLVARAVSSPPPPLDLAGWKCLHEPPTNGQVAAIRRSALEEPPIEVEDRPPRKVVLTAAQRSASHDLQHFYTLHRIDEQIAGISTRPQPLVVAPTGCGKTFLVRQFAQERLLPLLELDSGGWILNGASTKPSTLITVQSFIEEHTSGLILVDELDKFGTDKEQDGWNRGVRQEVFALLDRRLSGVAGWKKESTAKLARFYIVGCGTWQSIFDRPGPIGFVEGQRNLKADLRAQTSIPIELLFRFNANVILLGPPTRAEFAERILAIHRELRLDPPGDLEALTEEAESSGQNTRWLEGYLSRALRWRPRPRKIALRQIPLALSPAERKTPATEREMS